jgi:hypothetical protein
MPLTAILAEAQRPIRLGIIGTAVMGDRFVVVAFANRTRSTAEEFAALAQLSMDAYTPDSHTLLRRDDVDAVLVCVPIPQLLPIARDCLAAGKHVVCEKPPGVDLAEAWQFLALVEQCPRQKFMMTENFFYRDDLRLVRSLVDQGVLGRPQLLLEKWVCQLVPTPGEFSITPGGTSRVSRRPAAGRRRALDCYDSPLGGTSPSCTPVKWANTRWMPRALWR